LAAAAAERNHQSGRRHGIHAQQEDDDASVVRLSSFSPQIEETLPRP
jgi:hypothetical protein